MKKLIGITALACVLVGGSAEAAQAPTTQCAGKVHVVRFEDGSSQVKCDRHIILRIGNPDR